MNQIKINCILTTIFLISINFNLFSQTTNDLPDTLIFNKTKERNKLPEKVKKLDTIGFVNGNIFINDLDSIYLQLGGKILCFKYNYFTPQNSIEAKSSKIQINTNSYLLLEISSNWHHSSMSGTDDWENTTAYLINLKSNESYVIETENSEKVLGFNMADSEETKSTYANINMSSKKICIGFFNNQMIITQSNYYHSFDYSKDEVKNTVCVFLYDFVKSKFIRKYNYCDNKD